jgi:hypothetical protein
MIGGDPCLLAGAKSAPPRQPERGKFRRLFVKDGRRLLCELRDYGEHVVEAHNLRGAPHSGEAIDHVSLLMRHLLRGESERYVRRPIKTAALITPTYPRRELKSSSWEAGDGALLVPWRRS